METDSGMGESVNQDLILDQNRDSELNNPDTEPTKMGVNDDNFKTPDLEAKGVEFSDPKISIKEKMMKDFALVSEDSSEISESEGKQSLIKKKSIICTRTLFEPPPPLSSCHICTWSSFVTQVQIWTCGCSTRTPSLSWPRRLVP